MKLKNLFIVLSLALVFTACKPNDAKIEKAITEKLASTTEMSGLTVSVKDGVATITGECSDDACKVNCENAIRGMKGVKSIVNNVTVPAPVIINPDEALISSTTDLLSAYEGVESSVTDGVITLTGEISKDKLAELMQAIMALKPKKVENKLTIK
jgi:osmotically-inducible protein OsmY